MLSTHLSYRKVSAVSVAGGKLRSDEVFQEIKRTVDAVSTKAMK